MKPLSPEKTKQFCTLFFWFSLAAFITLFLIRASNSRSIWIDEIYTIQMAHMTFSEIITYTSTDAHPPTYYFLMKLWLDALNSLGISEGPLMLRSFGFLFMLAGLLIARWQMKSLFTTNKANFFTGLLLLSPTFSDAATDARNYALIFVLILNAYIVFCLIVRDRKANPPSQKWRWMVYALLMTTGLWLHLLSGFVTLVFGLTWIGILIKDRFCSRQFLVSGVISNIAILVMFSPWLWSISQSLDYVKGADLFWMTKPSIGNYLHTFYINLPFGRWNWEEVVFSLLYINIGRVILAAYGIVICLTVYHRFRKERKWDIEFPYVFALILWAGYPFVLWIISRLEIMPIFHAPRYPQIVTAFGFIFLNGALISFWDRTKFSHRLPIIFLLGNFVLAYALVLQFDQVRGEVIRSFTARQTQAALPPENATLYLWPESVSPYYKGSIETRYQMKNFSDINPADYNGTTDFHLLYAPGWYQKGYEANFLGSLMVYKAIDPERELYAQYFVNSTGYYTLKNATQNEVEKIILMESFSEYPEMPEESIRTIPARDLHNNMGWHSIEFDSYMSIIRWGSQETMSVKIEPPLGAGHYSFHLIGYAHPNSKLPSDLTITIGSDQKTTKLTGGGFHVPMEFIVPESSSIDHITFNHPVFLEQSLDPNSPRIRQVSFLFHGAFIFDENDSITNEEGSQ